MARPHLEGVHAPQVEPVPLSQHAAGWPAAATIRLLSRDDETGAVSGVIRLPQGSVRPAGALAAEVDLFVTEGALDVGGERHGSGWYEYAPGGTGHDEWVAAQDVELFLMSRDRAPDLVADGAAAPAQGRIAVETEAMDWEVTPIPGLPGGVFLKVLRTVPETGEAVFLMGLVAGWEFGKLEYHLMHEECFFVEGDCWIGHAGCLTAGSYFCRPDYTTHGPFHTRDGFIALQWSSHHVVNNFSDDPLATREQNRLAAAAQRPPQDHLGARAAGGKA